MQKRLDALWNRGPLGKAVIVLGVLIIACCAIGVLVPRTPRGQQGAAPTGVPAAAEATIVPLPTEAPAATAAPVPTATPEPTAPPQPTDTPEPTAAPSSGKVGDRLEANGIALTAIKVDRADALSSFQEAKAGNTFVVVEVLIENVSAEKAPYNPFYFKVKDADGFEYNISINTGEQALKSGELTKGDKARGTVAFEVKKDAKGLVLEYKPIVFGNVDSIKVALD